jgi:hypothetical protein
MALNFPVSTETSGYSATHRKMVARNPDWLVLRNLSVFVQEALLALRQIDGAHAYLPGEGSVLGLRAGNYIDSAGTLPGVLDSPVGLTLDALGVVGPELVTNGTFDTGIAPWFDLLGSGNVSWLPEGKLSTVDTTGPDVLATYNLGPNLAGKLLKVTLTITGSTGFCCLGGISPVNYSQFDTRRLPVGKHTYFARLGSGEPNYGITLGSVDGGTVIFDNISVKEITGIHASQNTTADKPVLRRGVVNLLTYSQDIQNAAWSSGSVTTGTNNRITRNATTTNEAAVLRQSTGPITVAGRSYTMSVIATAGNAGTKLYLRDLRCEPTGSSITDVVSYFNLETGIASSGSLHVGKISIVAVENGAYLCVINGVCSATSPANRLDVGLTSSGTVGGTAGDYLFVNNVAVFEGTYTAQQIQALGGIPLTTTAPVSTAFGAYKWDFDTTDRLALTLPAGYESATIIDATSAGPVTLLEQDITGTYEIVGGLTNSGELVTNGDFSNGTTNWSELSSGSSTFSVTNGEMFITPTATTYSGTPVEIYQNINTVIGSTYIATGLYRATGTGTIYVRIAMATENATNVTSVTANPQFGEIRFVATAAATKIRLLVYGTSSMTGLFKSISVKKILPSTYGRIILRDTPTPRQLELCQGLANRLAGL